MKQIKQYIMFSLFITLAALNAASVAAAPAISGSDFSPDDRLLVVRSADAPAYLAVERSFRAQLSQYMERLVSIKSINLDSVAELNKALSLTSQIPRVRQTFIVTIGAHAAHEVLNRYPAVPVLSVFIPRQTYHTILDEVETGQKTAGRSAVYLDQPDERLVLLAKSISRVNAKISLLSGPENGVSLKARRCGGKTMPTLMSGVSVHHQEMSSRVLKHTLTVSDVVIATPKLVKQSSNTIKWMLYMAYQRNIPVVGYSKALVDAGAIAAVYSLPEDIGRQAAEIFLSQTENNTPPSSAYPKYFQVGVNHDVVDALGYQKLNAADLRQTLMESALNCKENYVPVPQNKTKQRVTRR